MKRSITQERLRDAHLKLSRHSYKRSRKESRVFNQFAVLGIQSNFGPPDELELKRTKLEANVAGVRTQEDIEFIVSEYMRKLEIHSQRRRKLDEIQRAHNISGLIQDRMEMGNHSLECYVLIDVPMLILESDLQILREQKTQVIASYSAYTQNKPLWKFDTLQNDWKRTSHRVLQYIASYYDWAYFFGKEEELHLSLGTGTDIEAPLQSYWVCASNEIPPH